MVINIILLVESLIAGICHDLCVWIIHYNVYVLVILTAKTVF